MSLDRDIVAWLLRSLLQETELERFLASIPGFYGSAHVQDPAQVFRSLHTDALPDAIVALMHRTLSSDSIPPETRRKRIVLCLEVIQLDLYLLQRTLLSLPTNPTIFQCVEFVLVADRTVESTDRDAQLLAKCIIAVAISHIKDDQSLVPHRPAMAEHSDIRHQLPRTTCERETHQSRSARPGVEFCSSYVQRRDNHIRRDPTYGGPIPGREGRRPVPERNLHGLEPTAGFGACARRIKCQLYPPLHP